MTAWHSTSHHPSVSENERLVARTTHGSLFPLLARLLLNLHEVLLGHGVGLAAVDECFHGVRILALVDVDSLQLERIRVLGRQQFPIVGNRGFILLCMCARTRMNE